MISSWLAALCECEKGTKFVGLKAYRQPLYGRRLATCHHANGRLNFDGLW